ncbi:hypothetical protein [Nocardia abscessus]|uniref:hypothetical protein n=3 Tax=Nocardia TaxID=1817 RepID=UPI0024539736|nr:hypothetical protein [Nocardia abscessus]
MRSRATRCAPTTQPPLECGWQHVEQPGHDQIWGFWLPDTLDRCTPEQISAAITESAAELLRARLARLEQACTTHLTTTHPTIDQAQLLAALAQEPHNRFADQRRHHTTQDALTNAIVKGTR